MESVTHQWLERLDYSSYSENAYHTSRYAFGARYISGKLVLDIACGAGYGTQFLLSSGAKSIVGMDTDFQSIASSVCENTLSSDQKILFVNASATSIPLPDKSIDVIISFETIEHISDYTTCLAEFTRVLADDGLLILSTPNALVTQPVNGVPKNPFHVKEFAPRELFDILSRFFNDVDLRGQRIRGTISSVGEISRDISLLRRFVNIFPLSWRISLPRLLPRSIADALVFKVAKHNAVITDRDMEFSVSGVDESPVIVALCRKVVVG